MENKEMKQVKAFLGEKIIYDEMGQYIWGVLKNGHHQKIADLRGWGAIQNMFVLKNGTIDIEKASKFQDDLGKLIAKTLNDSLLALSKQESSDAVEFAEWLFKNNYYYLFNIKQWVIREYGKDYVQTNLTTSELYNLFKESLNPTKQ